LQPTLSVLLVVGTLLSFNVFDIIWLITAGGPGSRYDRRFRPACGPACDGAPRGAPPRAGPWQRSDPVAART
jgi:hypothetical protein